jgi:CheY-like chemotaxis protein
MYTDGEILIIEDDSDDREILDEIFQRLGHKNKVVFFKDSTDVIPYLLEQKVKPFMVISDINMPKIDGFELRDMILNDSRLVDNCVPYIFFSTSKDNENVKRAYKAAAQGYFKKDYDLDKFTETVKKIIEYWKDCVTPE